MSRLLLLHSVLLGLLAGVGTANDDQESWIVHGRVVDHDKQPVPNVDVSTFWNIDGSNDGQMEPLGAPTRTDKAGCFSIGMGWRHYHLLAIDEKRERGSLVLKAA